MKKDKIPYSANRKVCWEDGYNTAIEKEVEKNKKLRELYKIEIRKDIIKDIINFIEYRRDAGNLIGGGFSAGLCLSDLLKYLKEKSK